MPNSLIRVFVAACPPAHCRAQVGDLQDRLKAKLPFKSLRWVDPTDLHITLRFFGNVPEDIQPISSALTEVTARFEPFSLRFEGLGCFPSFRAPRVLWIGIGGQQEKLRLLQEEVADLTAQFGNKPDDRPFKAHLTLARVKETSHREGLRIQQELEAISAPELEWIVTELLLVQSHLSSSGSRYEVLQTVPLGRPKLAR